jgi:transposase
MGKIYSVREAAERLGASRSAIRKWHRAGEWFPNAYKLNPNRMNSPLRIPEEDLIAFEEAQKKGHQVNGH